MSEALGGRQALLLGHLRALARQGATLPSNTDIADELGWEYQVVPVVMSQLERRGLIVQIRSRVNDRIGVEAADGSWRLGRARAAGALQRRKCLRCSGEFKPESRFFFCCYGCRRANAGEAA